MKLQSDDYKKIKLYDQITLKNRRCIKNDLELIISIKGIKIPKTIEEFKELWFSTHIKVDNNEVYFSEVGEKSIERICRIIYETGKFTKLLNFHNIYKKVVMEIEKWFNRSQIPNDSEFIDPLDQVLESEINNYTYYCKIDGLKLIDISSIRIATTEISLYRREFIDQLNLPGATELDHQKFENGYVITGSQSGSSEVALEKFFFHSEICLSIIRILSCIINGKAIYLSQIRLINGCYGGYEPVDIFGYKEIPNDFFWKRYTSTNYPIQITKDRLQIFES